MAKMKTVLGFFVVLLLAGNAFSQLRPGLRRGLPRPLEASGTAAQEDVQSGIPGVTAPFIPFDEKDKIKYEDAVERAKKNDAEAYYWLAYYFAKGDGVEKNLKSAWRFLAKATELTNSKACYLTGLCHEMYNLCDEKMTETIFIDEFRNTKNGNELYRMIQKAGFDFDGAVRTGAILYGIHLQLPNEIIPDIHIRSPNKKYCYTNDFATGYVIDLYSKAIKGGLTYATNDIARLKHNIAKCRERIIIETEAREKAQTKGAAALGLLTSGEGIPGVTIPFIPFNEKDKIKYEETIERAERNDSKAFYWLAYYFAKGESVDRDGDSALKFLKKAVDANDPVACYTFGLLLENDALQNEDGRSVGDRETERGFGNLHFNLRPFGAAAWYTPVSRNGNKCLTNKVAVAHVESLYQKAVDGGLSYATNDIARLHRKVAECERRITQKKIEQETRIANAEKAKALIRDTKEEDEKRHEEETGKQDDNRKRWEGFRQEREYWRSWPIGIDSDTLNHLIADVEKKFNCIFIPDISSTTNTNTWFCASGKPLIFSIDSDRVSGDVICTFQKINSDGRIVAWGFSENRTDLEEFRYFESEREKRLNSLRSEWAKERGMSLEEAMQKYKVWQEQSKMSLPPQPGRSLNLNNRPGLNAPSPDSRRLSGLEIARARREARLAKERREAEEKPQREKRERERAAKERKAQLEQLMQIQEELRRQREERERQEHENGRP